MDKLVYKINKILFLQGEQIYPQHEYIILTRETNYSYRRTKGKMTKISKKCTKY